MSSDTLDTPRDLLSSDNIRKAFNIDNPRMSQRLANKKAPKEKPSTQSVVGVCGFRNLWQTDLAGSKTDNTGNQISNLIFELLTTI